MQRLPTGTIVHDEIRRKTFRLTRFLGAGGFGQAYQAVELNGDRERAGTDTCLKFTLHADEWHGEVYFGGLLSHDDHVVQMKAAFPTEVRQRGRRRTAFVIDMELVESGTVREHFEEGNAPWTERQVAFRARQLLKPLRLLHEMGVSHRDITPPNVFVGTRKMLKLGDFGITKAQLKPSGTYADVFNPDFAPRGLGTWWSPADDVYQVGLLMATLLAGEEVCGGVSFTVINQLTEKGPFRDVLKDCLRVKSKRPRTAGELHARLSN
jgi:serine/threonine protein kinase